LEEVRIIGKMSYCESDADIVNSLLFLKDSSSSKKVLNSEESSSEVRKAIPIDQLIVNEPLDAIKEDNPEKITHNLVTREHLIARIGKEGKDEIRKPDSPNIPNIKFDALFPILKTREEFSLEETSQDIPSTTASMIPKIKRKTSSNLQIPVAICSLEKEDKLPLGKETDVAKKKKRKIETDELLSEESRIAVQKQWTPQIYREKPTVELVTSREPSVSGGSESQIGAIARVSGEKESNFITPLTDRGASSSDGISREHHQEIEGE
jgi:hypothetical protein